MTFARGDRFGSYEIVELVGVGGMGEVYRARDTRLRRDVALKVLAAERQFDTEFSHRLEREALLLASLNHPSIATLYGIETAGDVRALVMEFVDGETLADRLATARNGLPLAETLRIAGQIVDALDAAHERGVVHRDLKPANIKLRSDGGVKVLDFGVAKTLESREHGHVGATLTATRVGAVVGTPSYMSPEQATGGKLDKRTDIWAFGCVLYEMLTGRQAFAGDDVSDTVARVVSQDAAREALPPNLPPSIGHLLQCCLQKDPKRRLRDIADARFAIEEGAGNSLAIVPARGHRYGSWAFTGTALLVLLGTGLGIGWWPARQDAVPAPPVENPLARAQFTRFTDFPGSEWDAAISPDGKFVVFEADRDGAPDVWLSQVGTGRFTNLTQGRVITGDLVVRNIGITHDGSEIWLAGRYPDRRMRLMPLIGGAPRDFLEGSVIASAWSPDGAVLAYHSGEPGDPMFVADRTGANATQIFVHPSPGGHNHFPVWSADGEWIYFVSGNFDTADMDLWRISPAGGAPERLTNHHNDVAHPTPIDSDTVLYLSPADDGSGPWLWTYDTKLKTASRISYGLESFTSLAASSDGRRLVATVSNPVASLWSVPILDRLAEDGDVMPYVVPTVRALAPRFGGEHLFYLSSLGSGDGLWRYDTAGGEVLEIWKGRDGALLAPAGISADGKRVAIALGRDRIRLNIMNNDGTGLTPLDARVNVRGSASWSPDGQWLVAGGTDTDGPGLFKIPVDGGAPIRLVSGPASDPVWSPGSGNLIVYKGASIALDAPLLAVRPDGTPVELPLIQLRQGGQRYRFLPSGAALVYMQGQVASQDFWLLDVATGTTRPLTRLRETGQMRAFDITPDGRQIVFDRVRNDSDIVLIDLPQ